MTAVFPDKAAARAHVWALLEAEDAALPPLPAHGRIPNFRGAEAAARRLFELPPWRDARRIKVNPDTAQAPVRAEALRRGIEVYVARPRLAGGFLRLDPARIPAERAAEAADRRNWEHWATAVPLADLPQFDAIVCGSVAVTADGSRAGKGAGYSDLEFAILMELGQAPVPVATTVHAAQLVGAFPTEAIDQRLAAVAMPDRALLTEAGGAQPRGVDWDRLGEEALAAMPILAELRARGSGAPPPRPPRPSPSARPARPR